MEYTIGKLYGSMHYLHVPANVADGFLANGHKRLVCTINGAVTFHCALQPKKELGHFVYLNKKIMKQLGLQEGATVEATFVEDTSTYQFDMPESLKEVLDTDPEADKIFHALTPGNQRGLIHLVGAVKSVDKQIERALKIATSLKAGITSPRHVLK